MKRLLGDSTRLETIYKYTPSGAVRVLQFGKGRRAGGAPGGVEMALGNRKGLPAGWRGSPGGVEMALGNRKGLPAGLKGLRPA